MLTNFRDQDEDNMKNKNMRHWLSGAKYYLRQCFREPCENFAHANKGLQYSCSVPLAFFIQGLVGTSVFGYTPNYRIFKSHSIALKSNSMALKSYSISFDSLSSYISIIYQRILNRFFYCYPIFYENKWTQSTFNILLIFITYKNNTTFTCVQWYKRNLRETVW